MPRNPYLCLTIVVVIGLALLTGVGGLVYLAAVGKDSPSALVAVVSGALGSLSSFLVSVPARSIGLGDNPPPPKIGP